MVRMEGEGTLFYALHLIPNYSQAIEDVWFRVEKIQLWKSDE